MPLNPGTRLGSYEVGDVLGAGGMGEVYRAHDTRLKRDVAIKVLPDSFGADPERLARFQREAELLASLNHPHIAGIYGLEDSGGVRGLVLELVEGPTLADRIAVGPIPIDEAIPIATQIADALEAAHEKAVVHRDLKPANVKVQRASDRIVVKVLDFGLAKLVGEAGGAGGAQGSSPARMSMSPTLSVHATYAGVILGTAAYMSPEQARGKPVDRRTDIWAFGCVLFEMLTGQQAFATGETVSDAIATILTKEPDWNALPASTPTAVRRLLRRCLTKDARERLHDIADARIELTDATAVQPDAATAASPPQRRSSPRARMLTGLAGVTAATAIAIGVWVYASRPTNATVARFFVHPPDKAAFQTGASPVASGSISPDGQRLAFTAMDASGKVQIWLRPIDALTPQPLAGTNAAQFPFWSPDSRSIGYFAQGKLVRIDASGGPPQTLCDAPQGRGGTWSREGIIVFGNNGGALMRVSAAGGQPVVLTQHTPVQQDHRFPSFLPDGRHLLFYAVSATPASSGVFLTSVDASEPKRLIGADTAAVYTAPGYLLFVRQGTMLAQSFNPNTLTVSGEPFPVAEHVESGAYSGVLAFSVSNTGTLAYGIGSPAAGSNNLQLAWVDRQGRELESFGAPGNYRGLDISPDGTHIAVHRHDGQGGDVWVLESRGTNVRLTFDATQDNSSPVWSPNGSRIAFSALRSGKWGVYQKPSNGAGNDELILESESPLAAFSWSPDGNTLVYRVADPKTTDDLWMVPLSGNRQPHPVLRTGFIETHGQISPNGKWLAYMSNETGDTEIYVRPFPDGAGKWQVSTHAGLWPRWRRDGRELFFIDRANNGKLVSVEVTANGSTFESAAPKELFQTRFSNIAGAGHSFTAVMPYAVSADGQRFLIAQSPASSETSAPSPIAVVLNWTSAVRK